MSTKDASNFYYYHGINANALTQDILVPHPRFSDTDLLPAYLWAEQQIGFYPLFMAVGDTRAVTLTGYEDQWRVKIGSERQGDKIVPVFRKKGEFPNLALLIFKPADVPTKVFTDYDWWHIVLNDCCNHKEPDRQTMRCVFKRSWTQARWHRQAKKDPYFAQLLVPQLDPKLAVEIWVRNKPTQKKLIAAGFKNVVVRRVPVGRLG